MEAKDVSKLETDERRKMDEALEKAQIRKKILKEKAVTWMRRHPFIVGFAILLITIQIINAYHTLNRMDRKSDVELRELPWRSTPEK